MRGKRHKLQARCATFATPMTLHFHKACFRRKSKKKGFFLDQISDLNYRIQQYGETNVNHRLKKRTKTLPNVKTLYHLGDIPV